MKRWLYRIFVTVVTLLAVVATAILIHEVAHPELWGNPLDDPRKHALGVVLFDVGDVYVLLDLIPKKSITVLNLQAIMFLLFVGIIVVASLTNAGP